METCTMVSAPDRDIHDIDVFSDHDSIVFTASQMGKNNPLCSDIFTLDPQAKVSRQCTWDQYRIKGLAYLSKNRIVFAAVCPDTQNRNDNEAIFCLNTKSGTIETIRSSKAMGLESMGKQMSAAIIQNPKTCTAHWPSTASTPA